MRKIIYWVASLFAVFSLASCSSNKIDEAWKDDNLKSYTEVTKNPEYKDVRETFHGTGPLGVYFKELQKGTGTEYPLQTSKVKVLYKGYYYDETLFDVGSSNNGVPVEFSTASTVRGFSYALQNMVVGDKWKVVIPYYLGYGEGAYGNVKGYTTLFFDVELVSITQYP